MDNTIDPIDQHVGARLRRRRNEIQQSQGELAKALGVSFQQVQKYERGTNRISASMMARAAKSQGVPPGYYFDGLDDVDSVTMTPAAREAQTWLRTTDAWKLAEAMAPLRCDHRDAVLRVAKALGEPVCA